MQKSLGWRVWARAFRFWPLTLRYTNQSKSHLFISDHHIIWTLTWFELYFDLRPPRYLNIGFTWIVNYYQAENSVFRLSPTRPSLWCRVFGAESLVPWFRMRMCTDKILDAEDWKCHQSVVECDKCNPPESFKCSAFFSAIRIFLQLSGANLSIKTIQAL